ncbi:hypothetical protein ZWY2020_025619 [Hordeum vulgare]|nr:hypothetical protein ZWY2020_025619 [Hordeum vulgare]
MLVVAFTGEDDECSVLMGLVVMEAAVVTRPRRWSKSGTRSRCMRRSLRNWGSQQAIPLRQQTRKAALSKSVGVPRGPTSAHPVAKGGGRGPQAGEPAAVSADTLHDALAGLKTPIATSTNPTDARASLEKARRDEESESVYEVPRPGRTHAVVSQDTLQITARINPRVPHSDNDARKHLSALAQSALLEEDGPIGPVCFGPRIRGEPFPRGFTLPRDTPKYNGTAKPEDWLIDYTTVVGIAQGNKRVAVRYVPLMLVGSARTWLNSLPAGSVNSWVDFEEASVSNFTGTYKRPGRPRELAMCVQRPDEPLPNYIKHWTELRNFCEGVREVQAIQYFNNGYRDGTLLKHKLVCSEPTSLAVLMAKADKYTTADSAMRVKVTTSDKVVPTLTTPKPAGDNRGGQNNNKHKADQLDSRSNNKLVDNMEGNAPATQAGSQRRRTSKNDWQSKLSFEQMVDAPYKMHTGAKPSTHTLRHCSIAR